MDQKKKRFAFIDLYRGGALLLMIETHVFNAFLSPVFRNTNWFNVLNFINGLVAPSFLFISGFAFTIASQRKLEEFRSYGREFWRQIWRIFLIFCVGYSLRLPYLSLQKMLHKATPDELLPFYSVDVLQCIATGLLIMFILRIVLRSDKIYNSILIVLTFILFMIAPVIWKIDFTKYMYLPLANYFNPQYGSLFPLFPWLAFMISGSVLSHYYMQSKANGNEEQFLKRVLLWSIIIFCISSFVLWSHLSFVEEISKVNPGQFFFTLRLSIVLTLLVLCRFYELWRNTEKSFVLDVGRESLIVYWLHLQVLYRKLWDNTTIYSIINQSFNALQCILATIVLIGLMVLSAIIWGQIKKRYRKFSQIAAVATVSIVILVFLIR
jgi:uncharacterized membrane protein